MQKENGVVDSIVDLIKSVGAEISHCNLNLEFYQVHGEGNESTLKYWKSMKIFFEGELAGYRHVLSILENIKTSRAFFSEMASE